MWWVPLTSPLHPPELPITFSLASVQCHWLFQHHLMLDHSSSECHEDLLQLVFLSPVFIKNCLSCGFWVNVAVKDSFITLLARLSIHTFTFNCLFTEGYPIRENHHICILHTLIDCLNILSSYIMATNHVDAWVSFNHYFSLKPTYIML